MFDFKREIKCKVVKPKDMLDESPVLLDAVQEVFISELIHAEKLYQDAKDIPLPQYIQNVVKPYIDELAQKQTHHLVYLPANVAIYMIVRHLKPSVAGETGTEMGRSTYAFLKGMNRNKKGHLHSHDIAKLWSYPKGWEKFTSNRKNDTDDNSEEKEHGEQVIGIPQTPIAPLVPEWFKHRWSFHLGDTKRTMKGVVDDMGDIDMYFIGDDHRYEPQLFEINIAWPKLKSGGVFFWDRPDYNQNKAINEFRDAHGDEIAFEATMLESRPTDGFTFTVLIKK